VVGIWARQEGHVSLTLIHLSKQPTWNICLVEHGSIYTFYLFKNAWRQIEHYPPDSTISFIVASVCGTPIYLPFVLLQQQAKMQQKKQMMGDMAKKISINMILGLEIASRTIYKEMTIIYPTLAFDYLETAMIAKINDPSAQKLTKAYRLSRQLCFSPLKWSTSLVIDLIYVLIVLGGI